MSDIAGNWRAASDAERQRVIATVEPGIVTKRSRKKSEPRAMPRELTPLGIGDASYPLCAEALDGPNRQVKKLSREWSNRAGKIINPHAVTIRDGGTAVPCDQLYGSNFCQENLTAERSQQYQACNIEHAINVAFVFWEAPSSMFTFFF